MIAEIVAIGDELTSGQRLDTNSQWLSQRLGDLGVRVMYHSTVGDEIAPMGAVLAVAASRADVVVCTGGLGPTADDLTREAIAAVAGVVLQQDDGVLRRIQDMYAQRNRPMPQRNIVQAMFPAGSRVIPNPHGTAPGIDMDLPGGEDRKSRIFALPGVPAEMREMWSDTVAPTILAMIPADERRVIRHRRIKCFGVGESDLEAMLPDLIRRDYYPRVGITVSKATITLRITAEEKDEAACLAAMESTAQTICSCLGDLIFGEEDDELHHVVARVLAERGQTLSVGENYTGGLVAGWLASTPEAARILCSANIFMGDGAATQQDAELLASEQRIQTGADFALCVSGVNTAGEVYYALAGEGGVRSRTAKTIGHPDIRRPRIAKAALDMLRKEIS